MKYLDEFRLPGAVKGLATRVKEECDGLRAMEVCGTHTMAISRAGLRALLSPEVELISGPGCPVCVTDDRDIDRAIALANLPGTVLATFGDMMKVPGSTGSLADAAAAGADVRVVYSPLDALDLARSTPGCRVVFLGVGFETTAPTVAATVQQAASEEIGNFIVLSLHKLVPPALRALVSLPDFEVGGFILPGHVSAVIGSDAYSFLPAEFSVPCAIAGFEPADILEAIHELAVMNRDGRAGLECEYSRAVRPGGNAKALAVMDAVFRPGDADWRGLFRIPGSGLVFREEYREYDASLLDVELPEPGPASGCRCGDVLCGRIRPPECPLFAGACTPDEPVGPCMVSSEGTCASHFLYETGGEPT